MYIEVIVCYISIVFSRHSVYNIEFKRRLDAEGILANKGFQSKAKEALTKLLLLYFENLYSPVFLR